MNLERLRWGEWIAGIAALDLLLVTFRAWYEVSGGGGHVTAWDALDNGRFLLIATAIVGIFLFLVRASEEGMALSFPPGWIAAAVGFACTVYIAYRLATPPADSLDPDIGLFLGLASAVGVTIGGLLSAREPVAAPYVTPGEGAPLQDHEGVGGEPLGPLVPDSGGTWSAAPQAAPGGWSPSGAAAPIPPATAAGGAAELDRPLRAGDHVALTTGGTRFPAGTIAEVIDVFGGGALVEVRAPDGMAERFEVPESAFERVPAGGGGAVGAAAPAGGESWSPAMPAPASEDWGFDESAGTGAGAAAAEPGQADGGAEAPAAKTPWWKRDIGGGKKKHAEIAGAAAAGAAAGALVEHERDGDHAEAEQKPGVFKRLFGGGGKGAAADETVEAERVPEAETTPTADVGGIGTSAESDTAIAEPPTEPMATTEPESAPAPVAASAAGAAAAAAAEPVAEPVPIAAPDASSAPAEATPDPDPVAAAPAPVAPDPEPETSAVAEPDAPAPAAPEPPAVAPDPVAEPEAPAAAVEPDPPASAAAEPEPPATAPEPVASDPDPEPPAAPAEATAAEPEAGEPEAAGSPEPEAPAPEAASAESAAGSAAAGAGAGAAAAAAANGDSEDKPKPKRKRSSGSRKVPKEAVAAGEDAAPKVGDEVQLKVSGGKYDAGTRGTVVDVFSAGVIVELADADGRTERLDLPFEAVGPADA